jgi:uncharacterized lipoprotein YmbA
MSCVTRVILIMIAAAAVLAGCGDRKPPQKTFVDPQLQALKNAREVENRLAEGAARNRAAIEQSSGSRNEP